MRLNLYLAVLALVSATPAVLARGDGTFQAPLTLSMGRPPGPVTVHAGDFNRDGKLDLVVGSGVWSNEATGSPNIMVLFQNPQNRLDWRQLPIRVGVSAVFTRGADMNEDGFEDIMVGDTQRTAFYIRSRGDGTFDDPVAIAQARGARWIALGDWNADDNLDWASANFGASNLTMFLNDGTGKFTLSQTLPGSREHTLEGMDYDGDGKFDLMLGHGLPGITPYKGNGNGTFAPRPNVSNLGCIEYIAEVGHWKDGEYILRADFNKDGKGDLGVTCIDDQIAYCGVSMPNSTYRRALAIPAAGGTEAAAINDLNGDGHADWAIVSAQGTNLWVYPGKGDGNFLPPVIFAPTGVMPVFLISRDLDGDGHNDVVSAEQTSYSLTIFWGKGGERFLESGITVTGFTSAKAMAIADIDKDGILDLLFPRSDQPIINVYLKPLAAPATRPSFTIATQSKYSVLEVADLNGDGIPDLAGADPVAGTALVALIDDTGKAQNQLALTAGLAPAAIEVGLLDEGPVPDLAVTLKGANQMALFLGQGGGAFAEAKLLPTAEKPKNAAIGSLDGDGLADLVVVGDLKVVAHYGKGAGEFAEPVILLEDTTKLFTDVAVTDQNGDSIQDVVVSEMKTHMVFLIRGKGNREFEPAVTFGANRAPTAMGLADLDGDGLTDITTLNPAIRSVSVLKNRGVDGMAAPSTFGMGASPSGFRLADMNADGALDMVGFALTSATILLGRTAAPADGRFLRGDVQGDGKVNLTDVIMVIDRLFLGGTAIPCEDAADADDTGTLNLTDPITLIGRLFLGDPPLPPPGPDACGPDVGEDAFGCRSGCGL